MSETKVYSDGEYDITFSADRNVFYLKKGEDDIGRYEKFENAKLALKRHSDTSVKAKKKTPLECLSSDTGEVFYITSFDPIANRPWIKIGEKREKSWKMYHYKNSPENKNLIQEKIRLRRRLNDIEDSLVPYTEVELKKYFEVE